MDNDDSHVAGDFFLHSITTETTRHTTFLEKLQNILPEETLTYIKHCVLRIPLMLIYDYIITDQFSSRIDDCLHHFIDMINEYNYFVMLPMSYILNSSIFYILVQLNIALSVPVIGFLILLCLLQCSDKSLEIFYSYLISLFLIYFDCKISCMIEAQTSSITMYILQFFLSTIYIQLLKRRPRTCLYQIQTYLCHLAPFMLLVTNYLLVTKYNTYLLKSYYFVWILVHIAEFFIYHFDTISKLTDLQYLHEIYHLCFGLGLQEQINRIQSRINIFSLLKIFWLTKFFVLPLGVRTIDLNSYFNDTDFEFNTTNISMENTNKTIDDNTFFKDIYYTCLFFGTETMFTLIGLASLISHIVKSISHRLFRILHLWTEDVEQIGTVVGIMFFLLLFQSNITRLELDRRHVPLLKAFSLVIVAMFHFLHTILEPQLLKVAMQTMTMRMVFNQIDDNQQEDENATENNRNSTTQVSLFSSSILRSYNHRYVYTCLSVLFVVILYITMLWHLLTFSTWLLAVTAFSFELIVRLLASFAQFTVYVLDAHNFFSSVESFDEYLFRIKAITSCVEFVLGVFLLCNGFYILCFESRGALRALMLAIHAYMNIIKNFRRGLEIFRNRKTARNHVKQLPVATIEDIERYNDICSICHNPLTTGVACITPCVHIFHQKCLEKAFYATQNCVLCSRPIILNRHEHQE